MCKVDKSWLRGRGLNFHQKLDVSCKSSPTKTFFRLVSQKQIHELKGIVNQADLDRSKVF